MARPKKEEKVIEVKDEVSNVIQETTQVVSKVEPEDSKITEEVIADTSNETIWTKLDDETSVTPVPDGMIVRTPEGLLYLPKLTLNGKKIVRKV